MSVQLVGIPNPSGDRPANILCFVWLHVLHFPLRDLYPRKGKAKNTVFTNVLQAQYDQLGKITFGEYTVFIWYVILVDLWIFRDPKFIPGWESLFEPGYTHDAIPVMLISFLLFALPKEAPDF